MKKRNGYRVIKNYLLVCGFLASGLLACGSENSNEPVVKEPQGKEENVPTEGDWDYENTNWEEISASECRSNVQSPVNINTEDVIKADLAEIAYDYAPFTMKIVDNGHTVQVHGTEESAITVEGKRYQFRQLHFHAPAEHTIDEKRYPLEMHLVHQEEGTDNLVVLGVLIEEADTANPFLEKIFTQVPEQKEEEVQTDVTLMLSDYIPPSQEHFTYIGSLTTPPCTVGVDWIIFKETIPASEGQINKFQQLYSNNARPLQPLNNRRVLEKAN